MKIGILTFHRSINYGAFMQSFALSQEIRKRYGDILEIIDFEKLSKHKNYAKPLGGFKNKIIYGSEYKIKYEAFQKDLKLLPLSHPPLITNDYEKVFDYINNKYDIVIVGSDAVWAYNKDLGLKNPYWLFGDRLQCKKMSYAASAYSLDVKNMTQEEKSYIAECLGSFSYIGVRDRETYNMVKSCNPDLNVFMNCDPTVLLDTPDKNTNAELLAKRYGIKGDKKIVSIMLSRPVPCVDDIIKKLGKKQFEFIYLYQRINWTDRFNPFANKFLYNLSPYEWYNIYSCFYLNLTTYFHGTLLALRNNVPTISFDITKFSYDYTSKVKQVLTDMQLGDFWYSNYDWTDTKKKGVLNKIDYILDNHEQIATMISESMSNEKKKSDSFFQELDHLLHN